jgi:hypothetical protein
VPVIDVDPGIVDKDIEAADFVVDRGADPLDRVRVHQIAGLVNSAALRVRLTHRWNKPDRTVSTA